MSGIREKLWGGIITHYADAAPTTPLFDAVGREFWLWLEQSKSLHFAATSIMEASQADQRRVYAPIALMLGGYAVEVLLKGVIIQDRCQAHGHTLTSRAIEGFIPKTHQLDKLVILAKLRTNKFDRNMLAKLSNFVIWSGRYPIPLKADGYTGPAVFEGIGIDLHEHPLWNPYVLLYKKLHRLAVRKARRSFLGA